MGLRDLFRRRRTSVNVTRSALDEARDPGADRGAVTRLIERLLRVGVDGVGPFDSAAEAAAKASTSSAGPEQTIDRVVRLHLTRGAVGGFVTNLGGFVTMPVALPANIFEFYVLATRMVAAIATVRGYDVSRDDIRSAVLLTLVGSRSEDILSQAGVVAGSGRVTALALQRLPKPALMVVNKAVGFRLLRTAGEKTLARFGRAVPLAGGAVGGVVDVLMLRTIARHAKQQFPPHEVNPLDV